MSQRAWKSAAWILAGVAVGAPTIAFTLSAPPSILWRFVERSDSIQPLILSGVAPEPVRWTDVTGRTVELGGGETAPSLRLESFRGDLLAEIRGFDGGPDRIENPLGASGAAAPVRLALKAGERSLEIPHSRLTFRDSDGLRRSILVPRTVLGPNERKSYWVSTDGRSFPAEVAQRRPDFSGSAASISQLPWAVVQPGFHVEEIADDFRLPVDIAFVPNPERGPGDPFFYVSELHGTIKTVSRAGAVGIYAEGLLNFQPSDEFPGNGERGLTGITVDPNTGDLFAALVLESTTQPGTYYPRVIRLSSQDGGKTASTQTTILEMTGAPQGPAHQISNLSIGPDEKLYVHVGDGYQTFFAQFLDSFLGKIVRMELDGSPVADNPFYDASDGIGPRDYVYAYGLRNPFGGEFRAEDGALYQVENGPAVDRFAKVVAGRNFLWSGSNADMQEFAIYNWDPAVAPVSLTFVQIQTFGGSGFPVAMRGHAFITESGPTWADGPQQNGKRISELTLDLNEGMTAGPTPLLEYTGTGKGSVAALAAGPDGLYFSDLYRDQGATGASDAGAHILRVRNLTPPLYDMRMRSEGPSWNALASTFAYDTLRGDLGQLRNSNGDFAASITTCLGENLAATLVEDLQTPVSGQGYFYLVRGLDTADRGSYESAGVGQIGLRDTGVSSSPLACF